MKEQTLLTNPQLFQVPSLIPTYGRALQMSPLVGTFHLPQFVHDENDRILVDIRWNCAESILQSQKGSRPLPFCSFEQAGPRERIFWDPGSAVVAVVTCGGLAPGLNNVVQSLVHVLYDRYGLKTILGVPFGFYGFSHDAESKMFRFPWRTLDMPSLQNIDFEAGSILGNGRGHSDPVHIVDALLLRNINILFTIGGDGTLMGAHAIHKEIQKRNVPIAVIGIPKTIDNDILWVSKSFGFESAVAKAAEALRCALTEARGAYHGIGLVKLMGRNSGALTATAAAAVSGVDFVLVPEVQLVLDGPKGFLAHLLRRVMEKGHATIAVAEGAGQNLFPPSEKYYDASGNTKLKDIGRFLEERILQAFLAEKIEVTLKYIDPSYMLRAQTTSADDSVFCSHLGQHAVHAAMAGKTDLMIGYAHEQFTHVPLSAVAMGRKCLDVNSPLWLSVLASTGQAAQWE